MSQLAYFTVRLTSPADGWVRLPQITARARRATDQLRAEGIEVRLLRSVFVPEDRSCFYLYEAASLDAVREAARRAGLPVERAAQAMDPDSGEGTPAGRSERSPR